MPFIGNLNIVGRARRNAAGGGGGGVGGTTHQLEGQVDGVGTLEETDLAVHLRLAGQVAGVGTLAEASVVRAVQLTGQVAAGTSSVSGTLTLVQQMVGTVNGTSTVATPVMTRVQQLAGSVAGAASVPAPVLTVKLYPEQLANLLMWMDASVAASMFTDTGEGTQSTNGSAVGRWKDRRGSSNPNADQATGSAKPTLVTNVQNGLPGVSFDGGDELSTGSFSWATGNTKYVVLSCAVITDRYALDGKTGDRAAVFGRSGGSNRYGTYAGALLSQTVDTTVCRAVCVATAGGANSKLVVDATETTGDIGASSSETAGAKIGGYGASTAYPWVGYIHETLVFNSFHDTTTRNLMLAYLKAKWGTP